MLVADQAVVMVDRGRQVEETLQDHVDFRRLEQVFATDHMGDALGCVVEHNREVVRAGKITPRQDDIANCV